MFHTIHGQSGQHATDLLRREILSPPDTKNSSGHAVAVPIHATRACIQGVIDSGHSPEDIINLAGVMQTSPEGIANIHFLFGPPVQMHLKAAIAGERKPLMDQLLMRIRERGIQIISTTPEDHDQTMAIIQGLSHFFLMCLGTHDDAMIQKELIQKWQAPIGTIQDMIFENPFSRAMILEFLENGERGMDLKKAFVQVCQNHLSENYQTDFGTPNFDRVLRFSEQSDSQIFLPDTHISLAHQWMTDRSALQARMKHIRGT